MKRKPFWIMIVIEAALLLAGIVGLFGRNAVYEFGPEAMQANFCTWSEEAGGYVLDAEQAGVGNMLDIGPISLPRGAYRVAMRYSTDTNMQNRCTITDETVNERALHTNGGHMFAGRSSTDFVMWLNRNTNGLMAHAYYEGNGSLTVTGLTISETNAFSRMWIFWVLAGSLLVDGTYCYLVHMRRKPFSAQDKNVIFGLGVILLFASMPLLQDYMIGSGDLGFHLMRVEGIKDNILAGNIPGRISPEWQFGYGYASPIFYGETLLYFPALLRLIGFSVLTSYRLFLFLIGAATVLISYFCFRKIFSDQYVGLLCSMLYTISVYRVYKTFCCGSLGETFGIMFLPLLAYGFFRVFAGDPHEKGYGRSWIPLTIGFTGLIQSHLLSGEMAGAFTILLCVIFVKKVFRRETFLVLAKTVVYSVLLSAWFLIPFADYMRLGDFFIEHVSARPIQDRGLFPAHLLFAFSVDGGNVFFDSAGMADSAPLNVGAPAVALLLWVGILFLRKTDKLTKEQLRLGQIAGAFAGLAMLMSLSVFPWDRIQRIHPILATLVSSLQFPNRWLSIGTLALTLTAGVVAVWAKENYGGNGLWAYFAAMTAAVALSAIYLTNDMLNVSMPLKLYNQEGMGGGYIAGAEYLPYGADPSQFWPRAPYAEEGLAVADYEKGPLSMRVSCVNESAGEKALELPLLFYPGYRAYDTTDGAELPVYSGTNFSVGVAVPAGYDGTLLVRFQSPWYWHAAEAVSMLSLAGLILGCHILYGENRKKQKEKGIA